MVHPKRMTKKSMNCLTSLGSIGPPCFLSSRTDLNSDSENEAFSPSRHCESRQKECFLACRQAGVPSEWQFSKSEFEVDCIFS
jgi:hypothetical protein